MNEGEGGGEVDVMTLDEYRILVERVMQDALVGGSALPRTFQNDGVQHASIVLGTMVKHAQSSLSVYSDQLSSDVWDAERIRSFVERAPAEGPAVRVLVDRAETPRTKPSALDDLTDLIEGGRVSVRLVTTVRPRIHIAVSDGRHVRIERDAGTRKADVAFGDRDLGGMATKIFDRAWAKAEPVPHAGSLKA